MILPSNFLSDIQSQDTNLVPIVLIYNYENPSTVIFLSTGSVPFDSIFVLPSEFNVSNVVCNPLLSNIPSIKKSIDMDEKKYKISSVSLDLYNNEGTYYYGISTSSFNSGIKRFKKFSDILSNSSLLNYRVEIFWKSQSTNTISSLHQLQETYDSYNFDEYYSDIPNACPLIYNGIIRSYSINFYRKAND